MSLGQSELFVPVPTRRLIVRPGRTAWWGVDSSTKRVAIGTVGEHGERGGAIASIPTLQGAARLVAIRDATRDLCRMLTVEGSTPGVVAVEQAAGFGKRPNVELAYAVGAVLCGVGAGAPTTHVEMVVGSKWKLEVCGFGGIKKPKPTETEEYAVLRWARGVGYEGSSWDDADAWAIADWARRTFALVQR